MSARDLIGAEFSALAPDAKSAQFRVVEQLEPSSLNLFVVQNLRLANHRVTMSAETIEHAVSTQNRLGALDYSPKVNALLSNARDFENTDFLELMTAAADQAGLSRSAQKAILAVVEASLGVAA